jgi:AraC-like DNA-binding protein
LDHPNGSVWRRGKNWQKHQAVHQGCFHLNAVEHYTADEYVAYTRQEGYVKINFWLGGRHTTVLDGYGECEHDRPEVFITAGPEELTKVDLAPRMSRCASVAVSLLPEFFPLHMGIGADELPEPLRYLFTAAAPGYAFHRFRLGADLLAASRAVLTAPFALRQEPIYVRSKTIELMCLLINRINTEVKGSRDSQPRGAHKPRLYEALDLLNAQYAKPLTLDSISREVGINRMALTSGFRQLFGVSVYDCLQQIRMEHAYRLLQDDAYTITQVAEAVGYRHPCNFSTAFRSFFGCNPRDIRTKPL